MASRYRPVSPRAHSSFLSRLLIPVLLAGVAFAGLAVFTVINGGLPLPFGGGVLFAFDGEGTTESVNRRVQPEGTVAVFACPQLLPAFTKLTRDHLMTQEGFHTVPAVEAAIEPNGLFRNDLEGLQNLLGRVLRRTKPVNFAFTESDFLPKGTRAGPSAGIPPGKRGVWIDISEVQGLADARAGDYIDLVAARSDKADLPVSSNVLGNLTDPVMKARLETLANNRSSGPQTSSWVVARSALVINPKRSRKLTAGKPKATGLATVEEVFLGMEPNEVALFTQALAQDVSILAAPRSGQPEVTPTEIEDSKPVDVAAEMRRMLTGDDAVEATFGVVEVIRGGERQSVTVPRAQKDDNGR